jgi:hypothetical protein
MSTAEAAVQYMTAEELLALPDDGVERDLIEGRLRERAKTRRNRRHSRTMKSGTAVVWLIDPDLRTVTVHRAGSEPVLFSASQELAGDPELPNFRVKVSELFAH